MFQFILRNEDIAVYLDKMISNLTLAIIGCGKDEGNEYSSLTARTRPQLTKVTGNMGSAILSGILDAMGEATGSGKEAPLRHIIACTKTKSSADRLREKFSEYSSLVEFHHGDNLSAVAKADIVMLGCKPHLVQELLQSERVSEALSGKFVISIIAGKTIEALTKYIEDGQASEVTRPVVARAIPNVAASVRASMTIIELPPDCPSHYADVVEWMFFQIGMVKFLTKDLFDVGTMLMASLATVSVALDGILDGCVAEGLRRTDATDMAAHCLVGLGQLIKSGTHPAILRESISSPGGCTIRGLLTVEKTGVRSAFAESIINGTRHLRDLQERQ